MNASHIHYLSCLVLHPTLAVRQLYSVSRLRTFRRNGQPGEQRVRDLSRSDAGGYETSWRADRAQRAAYRPLATRRHDPSARWCRDRQHHVLGDTDTITFIRLTKLQIQSTTLDHAHTRHMHHFTLSIHAPHSLHLYRNNLDPA